MNPNNQNSVDYANPNANIADFGADLRVNRANLTDKNPRFDENGEMILFEFSQTPSIARRIARAWSYFWCVFAVVICVFALWLGLVEWEALKHYAWGFGGIICVGFGILGLYYLPQAIFRQLNFKGLYLSDKNLHILRHYSDEIIVPLGEFIIYCSSIGERARLEDRYAIMLLESGKDIYEFFECGSNIGEIYPLIEPHIKAKFLSIKDKKRYMEMAFCYGTCIHGLPKDFFWSAKEIDEYGKNLPNL